MEDATIRVSSVLKSLQKLRLNVRPESEMNVSGLSGGKILGCSMATISGQIRANNAKLNWIYYYAEDIC